MCNLCIAQCNNWAGTYLPKSKINIFFKNQKFNNEYILKLFPDSSYEETFKGDLRTYYSSGKISFNGDTLLLNSYCKRNGKNILNIIEDVNKDQSNIQIYLITRHKLYNNDTFPLKLLIDDSIYHEIKQIKDTLVFLIEKKKIKSINLAGYLVSYLQEISYQQYFINNINANFFIIYLSPTTNDSYYFEDNKRLINSKCKYLRLDKDHILKKIKHLPKNNCTFFEKPQ